MASIVLQLNEKEKKQVKETFAATAQSSKNPYVEAFFKPEGASITIYSSGKVLFQGEKAESYARKWGHQASSLSKVQQDIPMIGTDEVGNGSYFGGLTVVASFVTPADHAFLKELGVDDSKKMTDQKIRQIIPLLKEKIPHQALLLTPQKYNQVIEQGYNAVSVKVALHNQAIFLLLQKGVQAQQIVIDAFTSPKNYEKYVRQESNQVQQPIRLIEKAESQYLAVAVSSIMARALFLDNLDELSQDIGLTLPSGAGHKSDLVASQILQKHGLAGLTKTAKLHFANTQKAQKLLDWGKSMKAFIKEWGLFTLIVALIIISRWLIWSPVTVDGHSMDPTLQDQEHLIMYRTQDIKRFDIVVASELDVAGKEKLIVKRVIGMPGDTIHYDNDTLYINDEKVDEPYLQEYLEAFSKDKLQSIYSYNTQFQARAQVATAFTVDANFQPSFTVTIPEGHYYLLGDDRLVSSDSRIVGSFPKTAIKGKIILRMWPLNRIGFFNEQ